MMGKPVDEENLRKRADVSSYESNMICASLERLATKSDSEIERTCFNNGGPSFYLLKEEELKSLSDDNIKCNIGSDNYKKNYRTSYKKKR